MTGGRHDPDIVVVGAGPAGVVTAVMLVGYGLRVALVGRPRPYPSIEGVAERALAGLRSAGLRQTLAQVHRRATRIAHWNGQEFDGNQEWLVSRDVLDPALLEDAKAAQVAVHEIRVRRVRRVDAVWLVELGNGRCLQAPWLIEARGRAAPVGNGEPVDGPATTAFGQRWRLTGTPHPQTVIEPFSHGWTWLATPGDGTALVQTFIDSGDHRAPRRAELERRYRSLLENSPAAGQWLRHAESIGTVFARSARPRFVSPAIEMGYARVGDAVAAFDPLSGHGLFAAVGGGLALAASLRTIFKFPANVSAALRFYREKVSDDFFRMARVGRDFYRLERRWAEAPFWRRRADWPDAAPAHAQATDERPRIEWRPVNIDGVVELREVIVTADHPRGVLQVAGVALVPLLRGNGRSERPEDTKTTVQGRQIAGAWLRAHGLI